MTFRNDSDFISFRHHVYHKTGNDINLLEVGPRFEMQSMYTLFIHIISNQSCLHNILFFSSLSNQAWNNGHQGSWCRVGIKTIHAYSKETYSLVETRDTLYNLVSSYQLFIVNSRKKNIDHSSFYITHPCSYSFFLDKRYLSNSLRIKGSIP